MGSPRKTECQHKNGDTVNGYWLCGQCYQKLPSRPSKLVTVKPTLGMEWTPDAPRQDVIYAPVATAEDGTTLAQFISMIADTPNATKPAPDGTGCKPANDGV